METLKWLMAASKLHKHRAHVTLLSDPTVHSLYCDTGILSLFQPQLNTDLHIANENMSQDNDSYEAGPSRIEDTPRTSSEYRISESSIFDV